jgi:hypothetical protein
MSNLIRVPRGMWPGVRRAGLPRQSPALTPGQRRHRRRRAAASTARTLVESLTTSVLRTVVTTRFWLTGATALQVPAGVTGESSTPAKCAGSNCHSRASTAATRRGSEAAGRTNLSLCHRRMMSAAVVCSARALTTVISSVCRSVGGRPRSSACRVPEGRARQTRSAARSLLSGTWPLSQRSAAANHLRRAEKASPGEHASHPIQLSDRQALSAGALPVPINRYVRGLVLEEAAVPGFNGVSHVALTAAPWRAGRRPDAVAWHRGAVRRRRRRLWYGRGGRRSLRPAACMASRRCGRVSSAGPGRCARSRCRLSGTGW